MMRWCRWWLEIDVAVYRLGPAKLVLLDMRELPEVMG